MIKLYNGTLINFNSDFRVNPSNVTQGSILGPLFFLIYINDLQVINYECVLFADDTTVIVKCDDADCFEVKIIGWLSKNKLKINVNKTKILNFKTFSKKPLCLMCF